MSLATNLKIRAIEKRLGMLEKALDNAGLAILDIRKELDEQRARKLSLKRDSHEIKADQRPRAQSNR